MQRSGDRAEEEIQDVISSGCSVPAKYGRTGKGRIYSFQNTRHGRYYAQKRVEVIYTVERETIITSQCMFSMDNGSKNMQILYDGKTDLLYLRLDERRRPIVNERVSEDRIRYWRG